MEVHDCSTTFEGWVPHEDANVPFECSDLTVEEREYTDQDHFSGIDPYEEDGGYWVGSNYTFDKRFSHGAKNKQVISKCVVCDEPWERYAAHKKCTWCKMEVLVCRACDRKAKAKPPNRVPIPKGKLVCPLCRDPQLKKVNQHGVQG